MNAPTVGVEEEYQLVDPETGALRSRADRVLGHAWSGDLEGELQQTQVEVQTPPCASMVAVLDHLRRRRLTAATAAAAEDLEIVAAGTHPFSHWRGQAMASGRRAEMLSERFGRVALDEHTFGLHVHVAIPAGADAGALLAEVRWITPLLLALSCSSPLFQGDDTGYASYRSIVHRRYPLNGPPPGLRSRDEHERLLNALTGAGIIPDRGTVYWSVRLNPRHPTVEFRVADACPSMVEAAAIAALARAAVIHLGAGGTLSPATPAPWDDALLDLNEWQAARYGLDATLAVPTGGRRGPVQARPVRDEARRILDVLAPTIETVGDVRAVAIIERVLEDGNGADRIRRVVEGGGDVVDVVDWLRAETQRGLYLSPRSAR